MARDNLLAATLRAADDEAIDAEAIVVARLTAGVLLVFDPKRQAYLIVDTPPFDVLWEFPSIEAFIREWPREATRRDSGCAPTGS